MISIQANQPMYISKLQWPLLSQIRNHYCILLYSSYIPFTGVPYTCTRVVRTPPQAPQWLFCSFGTPQKLFIDKPLAELFVTVKTDGKGAHTIITQPNNHWCLVNIASHASHGMPVSLAQLHCYRMQLSTYTFCWITVT